MLQRTDGQTGRQAGRQGRTRKPPPPILLVMAPFHLSFTLAPISSLSERFFLRNAHLHGQRAAGSGVQYAQLRGAVVHCLYETARAVSYGRSQCCRWLC